jgi:hypothetical protein
MEVAGFSEKFGILYDLTLRHVATGTKFSSPPLSGMQS